MSELKRTQLYEIHVAAGASMVVTACRFSYMMFLSLAGVNLCSGLAP